ncbi:MAG TPA: APC family permease [Polyangia bacterium]|nr:APC family permease [Polyangia bacterium]
MAKPRLTLLPLVAATYFMVSGGPYGLEEIVAGAGCAGAILILLVTPLVWSLPTTLMVGELAAALPEEGGYYAWVKRALGRFWGFQEAWLSLVASIFDMAIYPTLFTLYLGHLWPALATGHRPLVAGALMIFVSGAWNLRDVRAIGWSAVALTVVLLAPFAVLAVVAWLPPSGAVAPSPPSLTPLTSGGLWGGVLVAMWNYMGWDNASTVAGEVHRPQRTYPLAMLLAVALVALTYVIPVAAVSHVTIDRSVWSTGGWVDVGRVIGGPWLGRAIAVGGVLCGIGMFNALILSYSRVPVALAEDGFLPRRFAQRFPSGAPWLAVVTCCVAYTACLEIGFVRLIELDVLVYGLSLLLEFVSLVALRIREPQLVKPFRVPGGVIGAALLGVPPMALIVVALVSGRHEQAGRLPTLALGAILVGAGPLVYWIGVRRRS